MLSSIRFDRPRFDRPRLDRPRARLALFGAALLTAGAMTFAATASEPAGAALSDAEIAALLSAQGYTLVEVDEREDDEIEVYADKDGARYEIELSPAGEILEIAREDDEDDQDDDDDGDDDDGDDDDGDDDDGDDDDGDGDDGETNAS